MKDKLFILAAVVAVVILFIVLAPKKVEDTVGGSISGDSFIINDGEGDEDIEYIGAARDLCVNHGESITMHIHPTLKIFIDSEEVIVPEGIGIDDLCMRAIHTHGTVGEIHVEYPEIHTFSLGDFFANWKQAFNEDRIFDYETGDDNQIRMTVNGEENEDYEDLILADGQEIIIYYEEK